MIPAAQVINSVTVEVWGRYGPTTTEPPVQVQVEGSTPAVDFVRALRCDPLTTVVYRDGTELTPDQDVYAGDKLVLVTNAGGIIVQIIILIIIIVLQLTVLKPKTPKAESDDRQESTRFKGLRNEPKPYLPITRAYGQPRYNPPLAAGWVTANEGRRGTISALLAATLGEPDTVTITGAMLGDTLLTDDNFQGFAYEHVQTDGSGQYVGTPTIYSDSVQEISPEGVLRFQWPASDPLTATSLPGATKVELTFLWPQGIGRRGDGANSKFKSTPQWMFIEFRPAGSGTWETWKVNKRDHSTERAFFETEVFTPPIIGQGYDFRVVTSGESSKQFSSAQGGNGDATVLVGDVDWVSLRSFFPGQPTIEPNMAMYAFRLISSDQLDGVPDSVTLVPDTQVRDIVDDGLGGYTLSGNTVSTRNPALIALDILTNANFNANPIPVSDIDLTEWKFWQETCAAEGWEFRHVFDEGESVFVSAEKVARAGWASIDYGIDYVRPIIDIPQPVEMTLSPYVANFRIQKEYPIPTDVFRVKFRDASTPLWTDSETLVFGFNPDTGEAHTLSTAKTFEEVAAAEGMVEREKVRKRVFFETQYRAINPEVVTATIPLRSLALRRGSIVGISYPQIGVGNESTQATHFDVSGDVASFVIPSEYVVKPDDLIVIDYPNGTIQTLPAPVEMHNQPLSALPEFLLLFSSPAMQALVESLLTDGANGDALRALWHFGPAGVVNRKMRVASITYNSADLTADLQLEPAPDAAFAAASVLTPLNPADTVLARAQLAVPTSPAKPRISGLVCNTTIDPSTLDSVIGCSFAVLPGSGTGALNPVDSYRITYQHTIRRDPVLPESVPTFSDPLSVGDVVAAVPGQNITISGSSLVATLPSTPLDQSNFTGGNKAARWLQVTDDIDRQTLLTQMSVVDGAIVPPDGFGGLYLEFDSPLNSIQVVFDRLSLEQPEPLRLFVLQNWEPVGGVPFGGIHEPIFSAGTTLTGFFPVPTEKVWLRVIKEGTLFSVAYMPVLNSATTDAPAELNPEWILMGSFDLKTRSIVVDKQLRGVGLIAGRWNGESSPTRTVVFESFQVVSEPNVLGTPILLGEQTLTCPNPCASVVIPGVPNATDLRISVRAIGTDGRASVATGLNAPLVRLDTPSFLVLSSASRITGGQVIPVLRAEWEPALTQIASSYVVSLLDETLATLISITTPSRTHDFEFLSPGTYTVRVSTIGADGRVSLPAEERIEFVPVVGIKSIRPAGLKLVGAAGNSVTFRGADLAIEWLPIDDPAIQLESYEVSILSSSGVLRRTVNVTQPQYTYTLADNRDDGLERTLRVEVRILTVDGQRSLPARAQYSNPAPALLNGVSISVGFGESGNISYEPSGDNDFAGIRIWSGTTPGFVANESSLVADVDVSPLVSSVIFDAQGHGLATLRYYRVAAYDLFGRDPINISPSIPVTSPGIAPNSIGVEQLQANAVTASGLAANILDDAAWDKIASEGITKIAAVVGTTIVGQGIIQDAHIANSTITTAKIGDAQITGAKIANLTVKTINIQDGGTARVSPFSQGTQSIFTGTDAGVWKTINASNQFLANTVAAGDGSALPFRADIIATVRVTEMFTAGNSLGYPVAALPILETKLDRWIVVAPPNFPTDGGWTTVWPAAPTKAESIISAPGVITLSFSIPTELAATTLVAFRAQVKWTAPTYMAGTARFKDTSGTVEGIGTRWFDNLGPVINPGIVAGVIIRQQIRLPSIRADWFDIQLVNNHTTITLGSVGITAQNVTDSAPGVPYETRWKTGEGPQVQATIVGANATYTEFRR